VQRGGGGLWYLSSDRAVTSSGVSVVCAPDEACEEPPPTIPERPAGLPTQDAARTIALDVLRGSGMDVEAANVTVHDNLTQWQVSVDPIVDGLPTSGLGATVTIGPEGIDFANGSLGGLTKADEYPLLDTRAAIEQLNSTGLSNGGGPEPAIALDTSATAACADASCDTTPLDTLPTRVVTITAAAPGLIFTPSYTGDDAYLVPAYFFATADGEGPRALAIDISYIEPLPTATDPGAVDGEPGSDPGDKPAGVAPGGEPTGVDPGGEPASIDPSPPVPNSASAKSGG
jgi:hypothetical protein